MYLCFSYPTDNAVREASARADKEVEYQYFNKTSIPSLNIRFMCSEGQNHTSEI